MLDTTTITRFFRVQRRDLAYLKFIVEAYEGLTTLSTAERESGTVAVSYPHYFAADVDGLFKSLGTEIALIEVSGKEFSHHA